MNVVRKTNLMQDFRSKRKKLFAAVDAGGDAAVERMQQLVPELTGDLKSTIKKNEISAGAVEVSAGGAAESGNFVDYELHVEFGTTKMGAQSFYRPGIDAGKQNIKEDVKRIKS